MRSRLLLVLLAALALGSSACGGGGGEPAKAAAGNAPVTVRLGYFPNLTHATALVGLKQGIFEKALGADKLTTQTFNAGPAAVEALFSGALDATYIGPNPTINAFVKSKGTAVRVISGATSGGAALVVKPAITSAAALRGKKVASPQLGGTQDVALRSWLAANGLKTDKAGGGDVSVVPQENAQTLDAFKADAISGAWVPEPWATRLVQEGGGKVLVDEKTLWPGGRFVTTQLIVRTEFLTDHPDTVRRLLEGQVEANDYVHAHPAEAKAAANAAIAEITGKPLKDAVIAEAWKNLEFTNDPVPGSLLTAAAHAQELGLLDKASLDGLYDLAPLNAILASRGQPAVKGP